ncbi:hypothetical protein D9M69_679230 [compost metagenome]
MRWPRCDRRAADGAGTSQFIERVNALERAEDDSEARSDPDRSGWALITVLPEIDIPRAEGVTLAGAPPQCSASKAA